MTRVGILFSGRGSNMAALLDAIGAPDFPAEAAVVLGNVAGSPGFDLAYERQAETLCVAHGPFGRDRVAHEAAVDLALRERGVELVCLAGWMRLFTPFFVERWAGRMLNIHPSLLPAFPGLDAHEQALAAGVKLHGCTVHLVTEAMDSGPIVAQAAVPVLPGDDPATLAARVLAQEHVLYPLALRLFIEGGPGRSDPAAALLNPLPVGAAGL